MRRPLYVCMTGVGIVGAGRAPFLPLLSSPFLFSPLPSSPLLFSPPFTSYGISTWLLWLSDNLDTKWLDFLNEKKKKKKGNFQGLLNARCQIAKLQFCHAQRLVTGRGYCPHLSMEAMSNNSWLPLICHNVYVCVYPCMNSYIFN